MFGFRRKATKVVSTVDLKRRFFRAHDVVATAQGEEKALLDLKGERYYLLNAVGGRVWELLGPGATLPQIVRSIGEEYALPEGSPPDQIEQDVARLMNELLAAGLVTAEPRGTPARP